MSGREMIVLIAAIAAISFTIALSRPGDPIEPSKVYQRRNAQEDPNIPQPGDSSV